MSKNIPYTLPDFTGIFAYKGQSQEWFSARPRELDESILVIIDNPEFIKAVMRQAQINEDRSY
jgi:hypothetical protein